MATYLILNLAVLSLIVVCLIPYIRRRSKPSRASLATMVTILVLTAVFDSIIIWAQIVGYDASKILGFTVGYAPIEDFFYSVAAVLIVIAVWNSFGEDKNA